MSRPSPEEVAQSLFLVFNGQPDEKPHREDVSRLRKQLKSVIKQTDSLKNAGRNINLLPRATLAYIFSFLPHQPGPLAFPYSAKDFYSWIAVTHVCQHWRSVALCSPLLWSTLLLKPGRDPLGHMFMSLCGSSPATVYYHYLPDRRRAGSRMWQDRTCTQPKLDFLTKLHVVKLHVDTANPSACAHWDMFLDPRLAEMTELSFGPLGRQSYDDLYDLPDLFSGADVRIRKLTLGNVRIWPSHQFHRLTELILLRDQKNSPYIDIFQFAKLLSPLISLKKLRLIGVEPIKLGSDDADRLAKVTPIDSQSRTMFPQLTELDIGDWSSTTNLKQFLDFLRIGSRTTRRIWSSPNRKFEYSALLTFDSPTFHHEQVTQLVIAESHGHANQVIVGCTEDTLHLHGIIWTPAVYIPLFTSDSLARVRDFVLLPPKACFPTQDALRRMIKHLPCVTDLTIPGSDSGILGRVAIALGLFDENTGEDGLRLAPRLSNLFIVDDRPSRLQNRKYPPLDLITITLLENARKRMGYESFQIHAIGFDEWNGPSYRANLPSVKYVKTDTEKWIMDSIQADFYKDITTPSEDEWSDVLEYEPSTPEWD